MYWPVMHSTWVAVSGSCKHKMQVYKVVIGSRPIEHIIRTYLIQVMYWLLLVHICCKVLFNLKYYNLINYN